MSYDLRENGLLDEFPNKSLHSTDRTELPDDSADEADDRTEEADDGTDEADDSADDADDGKEVPSDT